MFENLDLDNIGLYKNGHCQTEKQCKAYEDIFNIVKTHKCSIMDLELIYEEIIKYALKENAIDFS